MSAPPSDEATGFTGSLRVLGDGLLAGLQQRLELLSLELQEEKQRLFRSLLWICAIAFSAIMAVAFASMTLVFCFPGSLRPWVLASLTVIHGVALIVLALAFRRRAAREPRPFAGTLEELKSDRACIHPRS